MRPGLLETLLTLRGGEVLFRRANGNVTAGQVRSAASALANDLDAQPGDVVLFTSSLAAFAAGLLGAHIAGRNVILPAHDAPDYIADIAAGRPFVTDTRYGVANAIPIRVDSDAEPDASPDIDIIANDLTLTFFTSGSTAAPKPVGKSIRQLDDEAAVLAVKWPNDEGGTVSATVPHHHIYGVLFRLFWPVRTSAVSDDATCKYWGGVADALGAQRCVLISSPAHLGRIPDDLTTAPDLIFSSGGPLPKEAAQKAAQRLGVWPVEVLGSTETGGVGWRTQAADNTAWRPLPEVSVTLSGTGELQVRSPHADGDGACTLGDTGELLDDGRFETRGRTGPVVKVEGVRVSLTRVESALTALDEVAACRTLMIPGAPDRLAAVVALSERGRTQHEAEGAFRMGRHLRQALSGDLAAAERPKAWRFVDGLPMNDQGKTTMEALTHLFAAPVPGAYPLMDLVQSETDATASLRLPNDLKWFRGHFPNMPILPGIAQVHMATEIAEQIWNWRPVGANLMKLKFKRVVSPGATLSVSLKRDVDEGLLWFRFEMADVVTSSGRIGGEG